MDCKLLPETDPVAFRNRVDQLSAAVDISSRLPARVFRPGYGRFQFLEFDLFSNASFWTFLVRLMDHSLDEEVNLIVIDVDADAFSQSPWHFGMVGFSRRISGSIKTHCCQIRFLRGKSRAVARLSSYSFLPRFGGSYGANAARR